MEEIKIFRFKIFKDRVVVQQTLNKSLLKDYDKLPTLKLSIILEQPEEGEIKRLYKIIKQILKETKCCFELLTEILQSQMHYKLELI